MRRCWRSLTLGVFTGDSLEMLDMEKSLKEEESMVVFEWKDVEMGKQNSHPCFRGYFVVPVVHDDDFWGHK